MEIHNNVSKTPFQSNNNSFALFAIGQETPSEGLFDNNNDIQSIEIPKINRS